MQTSKRDRVLPPEVADHVLADKYEYEDEDPETGETLISLSRTYKSDGAQCNMFPIVSHGVVVVIGIILYRATFVS